MSIEAIRMQIIDSLRSCSQSRNVSLLAQTQVPSSSGTVSVKLNVKQAGTLGKASFCTYYFMSLTAFPFDRRAVEHVVSRIKQGVCAY